MNSTDSTNANHYEALISAVGAPTTSHSSLRGGLWRRKGIILLATLCGLAAGYSFFIQQPQVFQAAATIQVYRQQTQSGTGSAVENVVDMAPGLGFIQAEMTSDQVLSSAAALGQLTSFAGIPSDEHAAIAKIRNSLRLLPTVNGAESKDRTIASVLLDSGSADLSTKVVNAVVEAYEQYVDARHLDKIDKVVGFFREGSGLTRPRLEELEQEYAEFRSDAPLEWTASGSAVNPFREETIRLEEQLRELRSDERQLDRKATLLRESVSDDKPAIQVLREVVYVLEEVGRFDGFSALAGTDNDFVANDLDATVPIETQYLNLQIQADLARSQYAPGHPVRQQIEKELLITKIQYEKLEKASSQNRILPEQIEEKRELAAKTLLQNYNLGLNRKLQLVRDDIADFDLRAAEMRQKAVDIGVYENKNEMYLRQISRLQETLDSYDKQLATANLPNLNSGLEIQVLRPAGLGVIVAPLLSRYLVLGGFVGAVVGSLLALLIDFSERAFRNPDEIAATLRLPILAHVPVILRVKRKRKRRNGKSDSEDPYDAIDPIVATVRDPHSPAAEAVRSIRTSLFSTPTNKSEYQVIQVTSVLPGDGKSTLVSNLASSVANANRRVVVVDGDLRRPSQSKFFGIDAKQGLTNVLNGDCSLEEATVETAVNGLFLLPTGPLPSNPAEALMLAEFSQVLDDLRNNFDLIVVDSPPLLAVTDASNIANHVDGVIMVLRIRRRGKPLAQRAITILKGIHANIIGLVVNAVGDSGYSATYATAWSDVYGGQPGGEYAYGYAQYGNDRYLRASKGASMKVRGGAQLAERVETDSHVSANPASEVSAESPADP